MRPAAAKERPFLQESSHGTFDAIKWKKKEIFPFPSSTYCLVLGACPPCVKPCGSSPGAWLNVEVKGRLGTGQGSAHGLEMAMEDLNLDRHNSKGKKNEQKCTEEREEATNSNRKILEL